MSDMMNLLIRLTEGLLVKFVARTPHIMGGPRLIALPLLTPRPLSWAFEHHRGYLAR